MAAAHHGDIFERLGSPLEQLNDDLGGVPATGLEPCRGRSDGGMKLLRVSISRTVFAGNVVSSGTSCTVIGERNPKSTVPCTYMAGTGSGWTGAICCL